MDNGQDIFVLGNLEESLEYEKSDNKSEVISEKSNKMNVGKIIAKSVAEYCDYSSIVGLRYLGERKRPTIEK